MELDRKELKQRARESMKLTQPKFWVVALVYFLMTTGLSFVLDDLVSALGATDTVFNATLFLTLALSLYLIVADFSYQLWSLWTYRRLDPGLGSLMQGFSVAAKVIMLRICVYGYIIIWTTLFLLIFSIPVLFLSLPMLPLVIVLLFPLSAAIMWMVELRYSLVPYLFADNPDAKLRTHIRRSEELMRGWKWSMAKLEISFVGWHILRWTISLLVLIAALWMGGFFQALFSFAPEQLPDLVSGFMIWTSGISLETFSLPQTELYSLYYSLANGSWTLLVSHLATLPVFLWLTPYINVCRAGFYDARIQFQMEQAPKL